jgi:hypothetical protein
LFANGKHLQYSSDASIFISTVLNNILWCFIFILRCFIYSFNYST